MKKTAKRVLNKVLNGPDPDKDIDRMYIPDEYIRVLGDDLKKNMINYIMRHVSMEHPMYSRGVGDTIHLIKRYIVEE